MSTTTDTAPVADEPLDEPAHDHPSDLMYVKVALFLGALTALEVATYFWEDIFGSKPTTTGLVLVLFPMMFIKFGTVIFYFMHLKYDNPLFKRVFLFGLVLATIVFCIFLFAMEFWSADYLKFLRR